MPTHTDIQFLKPDGGKTLRPERDAELITHCASTSAEAAALWAAARPAPPSGDPVTDFAVAETLAGVLRDNYCCVHIAGIDRKYWRRRGAEGAWEQEESPGQFKSVLFELLKIYADRFASGRRGASALFSRRKLNAVHGILCDLLAAKSEFQRNFEVTP